MNFTKTTCGYVAAISAAFGMLAVPSVAFADEGRTDTCKIDYLEKRIECLENKDKKSRYPGAFRACGEVAAREYRKCIGDPIVPTVPQASEYGKPPAKPSRARHEPPLPKKEPSCLGEKNLLIRIDTFAYQSMQYLEGRGRSYLLDTIKDYLTTHAGYDSVVQAIGVKRVSRSPSLRVTHDGRRSGKFETDPDKKGTLVVHGLDDQERVRSTRRISYADLLKVLESGGNEKSIGLLKRVFPSRCGRK